MSSSRPGNKPIRNNVTSATGKLRGLVLKCSVSLTHPMEIAPYIPNNTELETQMIKKQAGQLYVTTL